MVLPKEDCGVGPCGRISASCPGNEPNNRVCHLLAGIKWEVLVAAGETTTNSAKKSLKTHRIVFIQAEERKNKQNMSFRAGLRRARLPRFRSPTRRCSCSTRPRATRVPGDGGWRVPKVLSQPTPAVPFAPGQSSTC